MILWRKIEIFHYYHFDSDLRFPPFLLYVKWKSRVMFVRRCFRGVKSVKKVRSAVIIEFESVLKKIKQTLNCHEPVLSRDTL